MMFLAAVALAASTTAERRLECRVVTAGQSEKHFSVRFLPGEDKLRNVTVIETDRVFTPGNMVANFRTGPRGSSMTTIPNQRPGKWSGVVQGNTLSFSLKASDGTAQFSLAPAADSPGSYALTWSATRTDPEWGDETAAEGAGSCTDLSA